MKEPTPKYSFQLHQFLDKHEIQNFSKPSSDVDSTAHVKTNANNYLMIVENSTHGLPNML
jgi:hypothetical protein